MRSLSPRYPRPYCWRFRPRPRNWPSRAADQRKGAWICTIEREINACRIARAAGDASAGRNHLSAARRLLELVIRANAMQHPRGRRGVLAELQAVVTQAPQS